MTEFTISGLSVAAFAINMLLGLVLSLVLMLWCRIRLRAKFKGFFLGALAFLVGSVMVLQMVHMAFLELPFGEAMVSNPWTNALYMGISTALVEETFRLWLLRSLLRRDLDNDCNSIMFGIGQGGAEALYVLTLGMAMNYFVAAVVFQGNTNYLLEELTDAELEVALQKLDFITKTPTLDIFMIGLERINYSIVHISLSAITWFSVNQRFMTFKHFLISLGLRFVFQAVITLLPSLLLPDVVSQTVCLILALGLAFVARLVWKRNHIDPEEPAVQSDV